MTAKSALIKVVTVGLSAACCLALAGCSGSNYGYTGGVAATVNGTEIKEDTVTKYIQDYRTSADLTSSDSWAQWLVDSGVDASTIRTQVVEYYIDQEVVKQACEANDVTVDSSLIDEQINTMKSYYSSDDAWKEALESYGLTEDEYRSAIEQGLMEQALEEKVSTAAEPEDSEVLEMLNTYYSMFDGSKRSSHILFSSSDKDLAEQVLAQIKNGEISFEDAVAKYSTDTASAANNGDVGWDTVNSFVTQYTDALSNLSKGQMSEVVQSDYGYHIILCTDEYSASGDTTSLSQWPEAFVTYVQNIVKSDNQADSYDAWLENYKSQLEININDMPSNVPYNVDTSNVTSSTSTSTTE